jgi:hypothetical protein
LPNGAFRWCWTSGRGRTAETSEQVKQRKLQNEGTRRTGMGTEHIDIGEFESADDDGFSDRTDTERIVGFLAENNDRAWKAKAIAERTGVNPDSVSTLLARLRERGLVRHKEPYWAITDDEQRLSNASSLHRDHERLDDRFGEEDVDEWTDSEAE